VEVNGACCYLLLFVTTGCQFYPAGEYLRFVRVPENVPVGGEVLQVEVYPRRNLSIQPVDKVSLYILYFLWSYMTRKDGNREIVKLRTLQCKIVAYKFYDNVEIVGMM
jgi:hypothetical protein